MAGCERCAQLEAVLATYREIHDAMKRLILGSNPRRAHGTLTPEEKRPLWDGLKKEDHR